MVTADLILDLAIAVTIFVVILAIPRMMGADRESLAALHRLQLIDHRQRQVPRPFMHARSRGERRHAGLLEKHAA